MRIIKNIVLICCIGINTIIYSQNISINRSGTAPNPSAMLDLSSTDKGVLIPRVALNSTTDNTTIQNPATSLIVYNTQLVNNVNPGFYYWDGLKWVPLGFTNTGNVWGLAGNYNTISGTHYIGTSDAKPLVFKTNNISSGKIDLNGNVAFGFRSLQSNTSGTNNAAYGVESLNSNTTGSNNIGIGYQTLKNSISGYQNIALGFASLKLATYSSKNIAIGKEALSNMSYTNSNTPWATDNIAIGSRALFNTNPTSSVNGYRNIALGAEAMYFNTIGSNNISIGYRSLYNATNTNFNVSVGNYSQYSNVTQSNNTSFGNYSLYSLTNGQYNTALGHNSGYDLNNGNYNILVGYNSGKSLISGSNNIRIGIQNCVLPGGTNSSNNNVIIGNYAKCYQESGDNNVIVGEQADYQNVTGANNVIIGHQAGGGGGTHNKSGSVFIGYQAGYNETNSNRLYIENSNDVVSPLIFGDFSAGMVGINTSSPQATLDIRTGNFKIGANGTIVTYINSTTVNINLPAIANGGRFVQTFTVNDASINNSSVKVVPQNALAGLIIEWARVSAANTVEVSFGNYSGAMVDLAAMDFYITVIKW